MRPNTFVPSVLIVSGRSKGRRSYMIPPLKWQGWQRDSRIGLTCVAKSIKGRGAATGACVLWTHELALQAKVSARANVLIRTDPMLLVSAQKLLSEKDSLEALIGIP